MSKLGPTIDSIVIGATALATGVPPIPWNVVKWIGGGMAGLIVLLATVAISTNLHSVWRELGAHSNRIDRQDQQYENLRKTVQGELKELRTEIGELKTAVEGWTREIKLEREYQDRERYRSRFRDTGK